MSSLGSTTNASSEEWPKSKMKREGQSQQHVYKKQQESTATAANRMMKTFGMEWAMIGLQGASVSEKHETLGHALVPKALLSESQDAVSKGTNTGTDLPGCHWRLQPFPPQEQKFTPVQEIRSFPHVTRQRGGCTMPQTPLQHSRRG